MTNNSSCPFSVIIGLGNPGPQYQYNRHNIGFQCVDLLAGRYGASWKRKGDSLISLAHINGCSVLLVKPQTFMNLSGTVIAQLVKRDQFDPKALLVVHDELELPFGQIKLKEGGSHRGHNGLKSLMAACGEGFMRLRFGIGRPADKSAVPDYVVSDFNRDEQSTLNDLLQQAVDLIESAFRPNK